MSRQFSSEENDYITEITIIDDQIIPYLNPKKKKQIIPSCMRSFLYNMTIIMDY